MRKGIIIGALVAAGLALAQEWNLYAGPGTRYGHRYAKPSNTTTWDGFKGLMAECNWILDPIERSWIQYYDEDWLWYSDNYPPTWIYGVLVFRTTDPADAYFCEWLAFGEDENDFVYQATAWIWNPEDEKFNYRDTSPLPFTEPEYFSVPSEYLHWDEEEQKYKWWILIQARTNADSWRLKTNVCAFHWLYVGGSE